MTTDRPFYLSAKFDLRSMRNVSRLSTQTTTRRCDAYLISHYLSTPINALGSTRAETLNFVITASEWGKDGVCKDHMPVTTSVNERTWFGDFLLDNIAVVSAIGCATVKNLTNTPRHNPPNDLSAVN